MTNQVIPAQAVEAAAMVLLGYTGACVCHEAYTGRNLIDPDCCYHDVPPEAAREMLEAAAPHMLGMGPRMAWHDAVAEAYVEGALSADQADIMWAKNPYRSANLPAEDKRNYVADRTDSLEDTSGHAG